MSSASLRNVESHWHHFVPGLSQSSMAFYARVEAALGTHHLADITISRVSFSEGGILSAKREYLAIARGDETFFVCAAPYGNGFFVSWWHVKEMSAVLSLLLRIPIVAWFVRLFLEIFAPQTFYRLDTGIMFQSVTHAAVSTALDAATSEGGLRALTDIERKPILRDFFAPRAR